MRYPQGLPRHLLALLIGTHGLPAFSQQAQVVDSSPAAAVPEPAVRTMETVVVTGAAVGERQTRANVKITAADLDAYPPGVSADKVLERVSGIQVGSSNAFGGDGFESTISMRGFAKDSIGFSVDGIPNGRTTLGGGSVPTRYFDNSNLAGVDVSQSAGLIGSPSHQALAGHVNYLTQDPERRFSGRAEVAAGSADLGRVYARVDSGELAPGLTSYLSLSKQQWKVSYVDDPAGRNERDHVDFKAVAKLDNGAVVKLRSSYNERREESGSNIVTLRQFEADPGSDGYTDRWTGTPSVDRNYRGLKGNPRKDVLTYVDAVLPLTDSLKFSAKAYYHTQTGTGKETGLGNAGFPGMDGSAQSLYLRANAYDMIRRGALAELAGKHSALIDWRAGVWLEKSDRSQVRRWYPVLDEAAGPAYSDRSDFSSEDKHWDNRIAMGYLANRSSLLDDRLRFEYGVTYLDNRVDYVAPIQDSRTGRFNFVNRADVDSGLLPKLGVLYALSDKTEVFAGYAKNAASVTDVTLEGGAAASLDAANRVDRMDTAKAFDLGVRHKADDYALGVQGFFIDSQETVAADIVGTLQSENVDQGRRIRGIEMTYSGRLGSDWRLYGAYTYQKGEYKLSGVDSGGNPTRGFIRDGAELVGIAPHNLFVEATWQPLDDLKLGVNARHVSRRAGYYANPRVANSGSDERLPAYTLLGLNASYTINRVSFGVNVENLTDKAYISGIAPELMTSPSTVGRYFIGAPRTFVLWAKVEL